MISGKTFLKFIVVQIADEFQAGSSNAWRVTIYNGTAQDNTQLCFTNFLRYCYLILKKYISKLHIKGLYTLDIYAHNIAIKRYCNKNIFLGHGSK
jgi:hypothetical protein